MLNEALRADEEFGADHPVLVGPAQVGAGHVVEVACGDEDLTALEIEVEEGLEILEPVCSA